MVDRPRAAPLTEPQLAQLLRRRPTLFHMAERGAWPSIRDGGLLSTTALLDLYGVAGERRAALEGARRPQGVVLERPGLPGALVRDQKPMNDTVLARCLRDGMTPPDWYRLLNARVFFWLDPARLARLLTARPYRSHEHDVLEVAAAPLVAAHRERITLSPINSGAFVMRAAPRGATTFQRLDGWDAARDPVELAVTGAVPDIARFVTRVTRRRGADTLGQLWP